MAYTVAVEGAHPRPAAHHLSQLQATARSIGEPRMQWISGLFETFDETMAGRLDAAEERAQHTLDLGLRIAAPDAFTMYAAQHFVLGTFAGRHAELLPFARQAARDHPTSIPFQLAHAIVSAATGRTGEARQVLRSGLDAGFDAIPEDNVWTTTVIGYAVLAIELADVQAARRLLTVLQPMAGDVAFNGVTSQGPIAAYVGKLASLVGLHQEASEFLLTALGQASAFGWTYHRATTLLALAEAHQRWLGRVDDEIRGWLDEAALLCRIHGFRGWLQRIEAWRVERH
jgi:hypothetical protein